MEIIFFELIFITTPSWSKIEPGRTSIFMSPVEIKFGQVQFESQPESIVVTIIVSGIAILILTGIRIVAIRVLDYIRFFKIRQFSFRGGKITFWLWHTIICTTLRTLS
jgi:hypothetical protein